ncbi:MAG: ABC transporter permease subunit [Nevskia sp.]|nr:ABC transporter permease subunit [Nevskia sp.]MCK9384565.1 ABC transporter permease subunit [Nevskia sp.]
MSSRQDDLPLPAGLIRAGSLIVALLVWQLIAWRLADPLLPSPFAVVQSLIHHLREGELLHHLLKTLLRVAGAFFVAMIVGVAVGLWMGRSRLANLALDSLLIVMLNLPALVTAILCFIWIGLNETAAIVAVALNKIPTTITNIREGARALDPQLLQVGEVYKLSKFRRLRYLVLPQLYPYIMASARSGLALIWKIVLVIELLGRSDGIGFKLGTFFQFFDLTSVLAYTAAFAAVVLLIEACVLRPLDRRLNGWRT